MTTLIHDVGDRRKLTCTLRDEDDVLTDPTTLVFTMREPDGTITDYIYGTDIELVRDSTGLFHVYWDCAQVGIHHWRFEAGGAIQAAEETSFACRRSRVEPVIPVS